MTDQAISTQATARRRRSVDAKRQRMPFVKQFYKDNKGMLVLGVLSMLMLAGINLVLSWLIQQLIDVTIGGVPTLSYNTILQLSIAMVGAVVLVGILRYISVPRYLARAMRQYKEYAFRSLTAKNLASFSSENTSTYVSALSNDAVSIETNYLEKLFNLVIQIVFFVGAFTMMIAYSPELTLAAMLFALLPILASVYTGSKLAAKEEAVSDFNEQYVATLKDGLSGFSVVKSFKAEQEIQTLFNTSNARLEEAKFERRRTVTLISSIGAIAGMIAQIGVFLVGAYLALSGRGVTAGVVMAFVNLMNFVIQPIAEVPEILASRKAANALIDKLAKALGTNIRDEGEHIPAELNDGIELKDLAFGYSDEKVVLEGVGARFNPKNSYALVGASGSGKSTLLNLLMGASNNYAGTITYDGVELRDISTESLYDLVSLVQQNVFIFNASIRDNITMFRDFDSRDVDETIRQSGLDVLIAQKGEGYLCGENGIHLSGGERQRIAIARSLLRRTPILLVDEATSSLDNETAALVSRSILNLDQLTRIVVTHRLDESQLARYDQVMALKDGRIVEQGTFAELMEAKGYFYSLFVVSQ